MRLQDRIGNKYSRNHHLRVTVNGRSEMGRITGSLGSISGLLFLSTIPSHFFRIGQENDGETKPEFRYIVGRGQETESKRKGVRRG